MEDDNYITEQGARDYLENDPVPPEQVTLAALRRAALLLEPYLQGDDGILDAEYIE